MKKNDLAKILAVSAVVAAAAGAAYLVYRYNKNKQEEAERTDKLLNANAYILGGGLSAYAAALYLARDCGVKPENIHVLTDKKYERGNAENGYICRRGKIIDDKNSKNLFDLIKDIQSLEIPDLTVCDEILNIYNARNAMRPITFIDGDGVVTDISKIRLSKEYRQTIISLMRGRKENLVSLPLRAVFDDDFFDTNFWKLIRASYGFNEGSSAYEFVNAIAHIDDALSGTMPSDFDRYEEITEPLKAHIISMGVDVCENSYATDVDFENGVVDAVHYTDNGVRRVVYLNDGDICILPTDEMAECETFGSFNESAPRTFGEPYLLWQRLAEKHMAFKNPSALFDDSDDTMAQEFTITLKNRMLPELIDRVTCGALGHDGVIVLDNSAWKMTICAVPASHFKDMDEEMAVIWGTASCYDAEGEKTGKAMTNCSGAEILYELVSCLNLDEAWDDIRETVVNVIPCHRRYDGAYLAPVESKLEIIPTGISNLAISGDFADGDGSIFTEEYTVTTAKTAAYRLSANRRKIHTASKVSLSGIKKTLKRNFR